MEIYEDLIDAVQAAYFQPDREERDSPNRQETLGDLVRQRT
jgi:hypothetical protein